MDKSLSDIVDQVFDSREIIELIDEIESEFTNDEGELKITDPEVLDEYTALKDIVDEIGDEAAYGVSLIREDYFETYAEELANDIGAIDRDADWPVMYIDWEAAADALKQDYMSIDIQGDEYWYR
jgi:hypothetical protein